MGPIRGFLNFTGSPALTAGKIQHDHRLMLQEISPLPSSRKAGLRAGRSPFFAKFRERRELL